MRKGSELEQYINNIINQINALGWHGHKNNPVRTMQGTTLKGEPFDFEIFTPACIHLFDAKECSDSKLHWNIKPFTSTSRDGIRLKSQLSTLYTLNHIPHCWGYFLVWFKKSSQPISLFCFSPEQILHSLSANSFFLTPEEGITWPLPKNYLCKKGV